MLPNRNISLSKSVSEQLFRIKQYTGITPNLSARIAFFRSFETGFRYSGEPLLLDGTNLDKVTWLGECADVTDLLLEQYYPGMSNKEHQMAWSAHVEHGVSSLRNSKSILELAARL
ncbi:DNA sulfur modification protein DndE [Ferrimonas balearica]|uniref:DNA sulfur modification protein DndE n=1 Tax=Ferrimonas balearica TaxID=44012 RepID=UPI001C99319D|nr:DNA sulfur modification protein DndE [Ferrimonas balearica]MBY5993684.1 DNA sulfur modification protein DndE [Ferrimonas balearica]